MDTALAANLRAFAQSWPGITSIDGQTDPRPIAGTGSPSEHTWGNALDIYGSKQAMESLAAELDKRRREFSIQVLCYDPGIGRKYDRCTTKHTTHIHADFRPHCGGRVSGNGSASERATRCNQYQGGQPVTAPDDTGGGFSLNPLAGVGEAITSAVQTGLLVVLGVALVGAGVALLIKGTTLSAAVNTARTIATKGAA